MSHTLGQPWRWVPPLALRYLETVAARNRPRLGDVIRFLEQDEPFQRACKRHAAKLRLAHWTTEPQQMQPVPAARAWPVPQIETTAALAEWFGITVSELDWFADRKRLNSKVATAPGITTELHHYHYRILAKAHGAVRLIEIPKPRLKQMQQQMLREILDRIPSHEAVHGFSKGRSITTFASPHVAQVIVLRMDLQDFFPSFPAARVQALFRTAGYPESVADLLAGICLNYAPRGLWKDAGLDPDRRQEARRLYARPHLPQGTSTSPALANCLSYRMDCRLTGLARAAGATYTRYADDLAFSGGEDFVRAAERFSIHVTAILQEEGLSVHHRKTRIMRQGVRQYLAGTVVNDRLNIPRADYDRLKATLTNCLRHGPASQNREGHPAFRSQLEGRISFVHMVNPAKAGRLRALFDRIDWEEERNTP